MKYHEGIPAGNYCKDKAGNYWKEDLMLCKDCGGKLAFTDIERKRTIHNDVWQCRDYWRERAYTFDSLLDESTERLKVYERMLGNEIKPAVLHPSTCVCGLCISMKNKLETVALLNARRCTCKQCSDCMKQICYAVGCGWNRENHNFRHPFQAQKSIDWCTCGLISCRECFNRAFQSESQRRYR